MYVQTMLRSKTAKQSFLEVTEQLLLPLKQTTQRDSPNVHKPDVIKDLVSRPCLHLSSVRGRRWVELSGECSFKII